MIRSSISCNEVFAAIHWSWVNHYPGRISTLAWCSVDKVVNSYVIVGMGLIWPTRWARVCPILGQRAAIEREDVKHFGSI
jgi:hypothetical protein